MRIVFASNHYQDVKGYARVAYEILSRLVKEPTFEVYHFGWRQHPTFRREKIEGLKGEYKASEGDSDFGETKIVKYLNIVKPDLVILYECSMILHQFFQVLPKNPKYKIWVYLDQCFKHVNVSTIRADKLVVFSKEWLLHIDIPQLVLNHAPSTSVAPVDNSLKLALRQQLGIADNEPVFLSINTNSMRKRLDLLVQSFTLYKARGGKGVLILITTEKGYYNLQLLFAIEKAPFNDIRIVESGKLSDQTINLFLNTADYGVNTSDGEGWGIMACDMAYLGKPQLVLDIGAYRSFLDDSNSVLIKPTLHIYRGYADYCGLIKETTTPEIFSEGFDAVQTKSNPSVSFTWDTVVKGFIEELKRV
jgi:glycosyltransferase involved in cell wall biosynthesis